MEEIVETHWWKPSEKWVDVAENSLIQFWRRVERGTILKAYVALVQLLKWTVE